MGLSWLALLSRLMITVVESREIFFCAGRAVAQQKKRRDNRVSRANKSFRFRGGFRLDLGLFTGIDL